ncbi:septum formation initiator [Clostridium sp. CAG:798]|jgi:cell division protein DivIC|nr:septum formation initiator [Clostridium sp. CAG:798]HBJ11954.1 septation inhibitor protein [Clostridiales bacterium]
MKKKKTYKILFLLILFGYIIYIFINQQQILNAYKSDEKRYALQIEEAKTKNSNLIAKKENVNSKEFIEEIARDKLDMYLPNERVYIDIGK